ncbi:MAG: MFS transporter, partial [Chloroflexi bacterium]
SQAFMGMLSDNSTLRWGRRRPFLVISTLLNSVFVVAIAFSSGMSGMSGFWFLFIIGILLQISSNIGQAAEQAFIPDVVPMGKRGKFSGVKALLELPLPMALAFLSGQFLVKKGMIREALYLAIGVFVISTLVAMLVPEKRNLVKQKLNWQPFLRLLAMTVVFTAVILSMGEGVKLLSGFTASLESFGAQFIMMGLAGLAGMLVAVGLGVWVSVRISIGGGEARKNPSFTWWVINRLAFLVGATNLSTFTVYFMQARLGYEGAEAAGPGTFLLLFVAGFIMISTIPSGALADRFGRKRLVALSGVLASIGTLIAISVPSLPVIYTGGSIIGIATGLFFTANWALGTEIVPKQEAARYLGISNLAGAGAGAVGAYIGGPIADHFTRNFPDMQGIGYVLLFGIYGTMFLLSILPLLRVRETREVEAVPVVQSV